MIGPIGSRTPPHSDKSEPNLIIELLNNLNYDRPSTLPNWQIQGRAGIDT
jgi:hypothetical protein